MITGLILVSAVIMLSANPSACDTNQFPATQCGIVSVKDTADSSPFFRFYKDFITPVDGDRCLMYPSCSEYSRQAFKKYGFIRGFIMTADRLTRCGSDLYLYNTVRIEGNTFYSDTIDENTQLIYSDK